MLDYMTEDLSLLDRLEAYNIVAISCREEEFIDQETAKFIDQEYSGYTGLLQTIRRLELA